jgi:cyclic pyranopterin phosphate synthase
MTNQAPELQPLSSLAQTTIQLMRAEAQFYRQPLIGTEHLLLGLIRTPAAPAAHVLASFDVTLARARDAVELLAGHGPQRQRAADSPLNLTERTDEVLHLAERLRRALGHAVIEPEHLLLALLNVAGGAALGVLQTLGVEREQLRDATLGVLHGQMHPSAATLASTPADSSPQLTHLDAQGQARMVDVGAKADTMREAIARGTVLMQAETLALITAGDIAKGDVLATARIAGIMAAKQTSSLIPLCHPLMLTHVSVTLTPDEARSALLLEATVRTRGKTGVEMEALTAVTVAALTVYDMCKAVDRGMRISDVRLAEKRGGKSGEIVLE